MKPVLRIASQAYIWVLMFLTVFPFYWVTVMSTHDRTEIFAVPPHLFFGDNLIDNYVALLKAMPFWLVLANSLYLAIIGTFFSVIFCSMTAYGFIAFKFRGRSVLFGLLIATLTVPPVLNLIPNFLTARFLGILDTHFAVWFPASASAFGIFLVRQYIVTAITREIIDAARVDGAGDFRIYWSIILPLIKPALATVAIVSFVGLWNNFLGPLILISSRDKFVLTLSLRSLQSVGNTPWGAVMLGTVLSMLPLLIAFLFSSKQMIAGLTAGAVKG